jgi:hypothetical protein
MNIINSIVILLVMLIVANGIMDGAVSDGVNELMTSDEKADMRNSLYCVAGLMIYPPTKEVFGITVPMPSFDDLVISAAIASAILFVLHMVNVKMNWKRALLLYTIVWFLFKMSGYALIKMSGTGCETAMVDMADAMSGFYTATSLIGLGALYKIIKATKGIK